MEGHLDALLTLDHAVGTWQSSRKRLTSLDADEPRTTQLAASLTTQEREIAGRRDALLATESRLRRHISEIDRGQSETRKLLLQLKGHVHRGTCPLCGADHRTTDELLRRIEEQTVADAGSTARERTAANARECNDGRRRTLSCTGEAGGRERSPHND